MRRWRLCFLPLVLVGVVAMTDTTGAATAPHKAHVTVSPSVELASGRVVSITGTHFAPRRKYTIEECSQSSFVVMMRLCNDGHAVHVKTDRNGAFRSKLTVEVCPAPRAAATPSAAVKVCYVGAPTLSGVDVNYLLGAAKITVKLVG